MPFSPKLTSVSEPFIESTYPSQTNITCSPKATLSSTQLNLVSILNVFHDQLRKNLFVGARMRKNDPFEFRCKIYETKTTNMKPSIDDEWEQNEERWQNPKTNESCEQTNATWQFLEPQTRNSETNLERTTNRALITRWWRTVSDLGMNFVLDRNGMNPKTKREKWKTSIWGFSEREEITPLGGGSKISEEDLPRWIGDSKIKIGGSEENLETWEKTQIFI